MPDARIPALVDVADIPNLRALIAHWRDDLRSGGVAWYAEQRLLEIYRQHGMRPEFV